MVREKRLLQPTQLPGTAAKIGDVDHKYRQSVYKETSPNKFPPLRIVEQAVASTGNIGTCDHHTKINTVK